MHNKQSMFFLQIENGAPENVWQASVVLENETKKAMKSP